MIIMEEFAYFREKSLWSVVLPQNTNVPIMQPKNILCWNISVKDFCSIEAPPIASYMLCNEEKSSTNIY